MTIDWKDLKRQKRMLSELVLNSGAAFKVTKYESEQAEGLLSLIGVIQDQASGILGDEVVFPKLEGEESDV